MSHVATNSLHKAPESNLPSWMHATVLCKLKDFSHCSLHLHSKPAELLLKLNQKKKEKKRGLALMLNAEVFDLFSLEICLFIEWRTCTTFLEYREF